MSAFEITLSGGSIDWSASVAVDEAQALAGERIGSSWLTGLNVGYGADFTMLVPKSSAEQP